MGQHRAHLGPVGPRWASYWPYECCYLVCSASFILFFSCSISYQDTVPPEKVTQPINSSEFLLSLTLHIHILIWCNFLLSMSHIWSRVMVWLYCYIWCCVNKHTFNMTWLVFIVILYVISWYITPSNNGIQLYINSDIEMVHLSWKCIFLHLRILFLY